MRLLSDSVIKMYLISIQAVCYTIRAVKGSMLLCDREDPDLKLLFTDN